ncbi:hypothetical protein GCM10009827_101040 [Dactylosporangium maewongense]|uniref:Uncharacterized protein n=1 Tax=Dactylosporangium maewongense TaxID=634393 RepID=A0ABP4NQS8_9ACTN
MSHAAAVPAPRGGGGGAGRVRAAGPRPNAPPRLDRRQALRQPKPARILPFRAQGYDSGYAPGGQRSPFPARTGCDTAAGTRSDARMAGWHALSADG